MSWFWIDVATVGMFCVCRMMQNKGCVWRQIGDKISWPWKHFFASKIVLQVIVCCRRGVGSMSSSRRIPRFIVVFSSGHRWLFFVASLWGYVVVASFLGTLSNNDDDGSENVAKKMNLRSYKVNRVYLNPLNMSNAGDFSWS